MNLPQLVHPQAYTGLYVFDFGDHAAIGYTAEEIQTLLASPQHKDGKAYKIHRASPEGRLELRGVSRPDVSVQEAMMFSRRSSQQARQDFEQLKHLALQTAPPTPLHWHLASNPDQNLAEFTILLYAAEYSDAVGHWLTAIGFEGGDLVDAGTQIAEDFGTGPASEHEHVAIAPDRRYHSRPPAEVLANVDQAIQRDLNTNT